MDDTADWLSEDVVEDSPAAPATAGAADEATPAAAEGAAAEGEATSLPVAEPERPKDPNRVQLFRHWSRPVHVQYSYLYDYRKNYYDDVLDYMDRRSKGIHRDVPRAQTWAERALRTYVQKGSSTSTSSSAYERRRTDSHLLSSIHTGAKFYQYHSKEYMSRRYPALLR